jgi:sec-independent protein translocase protein TatC
MTWLNKLLRKLFTIREQQDGDVVKPFLDHLEDLRGTIFKLIASLAGGTLIAFFFRKEIMDLLQRPLQWHPGIKLIATGLVTPFMISLKLSLYAGVVISFPLLLWHIASFVLPALTRREKRLLFPGVVGSFILFGLGVLAAYWFVLPKTIDFFVKYSDEVGIKLLLDAGQYFSLVANLCIACGLLSEMPIVMFALSAMGLVSFELLSKTRVYAFTIILILVALIAPSPDPITFVVMGLPVLSIYELCIWIVWLMERRRKKQAR